MNDQGGYQHYYMQEGDYQKVQNIVNVKMEELIVEPFIGVIKSMVRAKAEPLALVDKITKKSKD
jgi:hypothetical protein